MEGIKAVRGHSCTVFIFAALSTITGPSIFAETSELLGTYVKHFSSDVGLSRAQSILIHLLPPGKKYDKTDDALLYRVRDIGGFSSLVVHFGEEKIDPVADVFPSQWAGYGTFQLIEKIRMECSAEQNLYDRPALIVGACGGAIAAQHFAEQRPEWCDAAAIIGGHTFVQSRSAQCPLLFVSGGPNSNISSINRCVAYYQKKTTPSSSSAASPTGPPSAIPTAGSSTTQCRRKASNSPPTGWPASATGVMP
jgi:hypothetical protein